MRLNQEILDTIKFETPGLSKSGNKNVQKIVDFLPSDYCLELHSYASKRKNLCPHLLMQANALLLEKIGADFTVSFQTTADVLLLSKNKTLLGCALFSSHCLIAIASSQSHQGIGTLLYSFSQILNNGYVFFKIQDSAINFYKKMLAKKISGCNWDHRVSPDDALTQFAQKITTYFPEQVFIQEKRQLHVRESASIRNAYYLKLGFFKNHSPYPVSHSMQTKNSNVSQLNLNDAAMNA